MSLVTCSECGARVSTRAKACPACGSRTITTGQKLTGGVKKGVGFGCLGIVGIIVLAAILTPHDPPPAPKTLAQQAEDDIANHRAAVAQRAAQSLKDSLRDPSSLDIEKILVDDLGDTVCMTYRARNGFGGLNVERIVFFKAKARSGRSSWNKHCAHQSMFNETLPNWVLR